MARQTQEKEIDGFRFSVQQLPGMRSLRLMHKLAKALGPGVLKALSGAPEGAGGGVSLGNLDLGNLADGLSLLFDKFSADDFEAVVRELFETATVTENGNTFPMMQVFDNTFAGRPDVVLKAVQFALEVNYKSFFGVFLAAARGAGSLSGISKS